MRGILGLSALLLLPLASAAPLAIAAASDDCITELLVVWGPHVPGGCSASLDGALDVACTAVCTVTFTGTSSATSLVPSGAGVFAWLVHGDVSPCVYSIPFFAQGLPPCGADSHYAYGCTAVVELASGTSCASRIDVAFPTAPGGCTSFIVGATGYGRLRAPPSPSPPPYTVLVYDSAFAQAHFRLERAADGSGTITAGAC